MAGSMQYQKILKYKVKAVCAQPMHIGSAVGDKQEVLVHPIDKVPFVQATSIAGVFRGYFKEIYTEKEADLLFGARKLEENANSYEYGSRLRFSDGMFISGQNAGLALELRPRVGIDRRTGTATESQIKGTAMDSGHKFNIEYIGAGAEFRFSVYLYDENYQTAVEEIFAAFGEKEIQLGGQKSNGCGQIALKSLQFKCFDMTKAEDRKLWAQEEELPETAYQEKLTELKAKALYRNAYEILVEGQTENELQVKSVGVTETGKGAPDSTNMQNVAKEYIVPGSSLKGAVRSQMEKIAAYLGQEKVIEDTFGCTGKSGNIQFYDTVVGEKEVNDLAPLRSKIHVDKFTGGTITGSLHNEKNVSGKLTFRMMIADKNQPGKTCGLLLMALRDMAIGTMSIGNGYRTGKGIIDVDKVIVKSLKDDKQACIDFKSGTIEKEEVISECILAIQRKESEDAV